MFSIEETKGYWVHNLSPFLIEFSGSWTSWGPGGIRWYGVSYLAGFFIAYLLLVRAFKLGKSPYDQGAVHQLDDFSNSGSNFGRQNWICSSLPN